MPPNPAAVVRALRKCREAMIEVERHVKPTGPVYKATSAIQSGINALATLLTGDAEYFWDKGSVGRCPNELKDKLAREAGEKPWQSLTS